MLLDQTHDANPASVTLTVLQVAGVRSRPAPPAGETVAGQSVYVPMKIINTGNGMDQMNLSISSANGWPVAIIYDDNADGVHQSTRTDRHYQRRHAEHGPRRLLSVLCQVTVPSDATTGDTLTVTAISAFDPVSGVAAAAVTVPAPNVTATGLTIVANPSEQRSQPAVTLTGQITPAMVQSIAISITDPSNTVIQFGVSTDSTGAYQTSFQPSSTGVYSIRASFAGAEATSPVRPLPAVAVSNKAVTALLLTATPNNPRHTRASPSTACSVRRVKCR